MMCGFCGSRGVRAKLVRRNRTPYLVASFEASEPPMVWQLDLKAASSFTVSLQEKEGEWTLGTTAANGEFTPVAHFEERGSAEAAYRAIVRALSCHVGESGWLRGLMKVLVGLAIMAALLFGALSIAKVATMSGVKQASQTARQMVLEAAPEKPEKKAYSIGEIPTGEPVPADEVLPR